MLTAASAVRERVDGLGLGADDYLSKPLVQGDLWEILAKRGAAKLFATTN